MIKENYFTKYAVLLSCVLHGVIIACFFMQWSKSAGPSHETLPSIPLELATIGEQTMLTNLVKDKQVEKKKPEAASLSPPAKRDIAPQEEEMILPPKESKIPARKAEKSKPVKPKPPENTIQGLLSKIPDLEKEWVDPKAKKAEATIVAPEPKPVQRLMVSELDAFRLQVEKCWNVPIGAKDIEKTVITVHVTFTKEGYLREKPQVMEWRTDPFFTILARSAVHAVEQCQPFQLPENKYETWKEMDVIFNPQDML